MKKGFWNGLITGGLVGAVMYMMVAPQFKKERATVMRETKQANGKARRVIKGVRNMAEDWMK